MSQIILPKPIASHPLDPLNVLGHVRVGDVSLKINLISEVELYEGNDLLVIMASGIKYNFRGDDAKTFLALLNEIATAIIEKMTSQIQTVPAGTQLRWP